MKSMYFEDKKTNHIIKKITVTFTHLLTKHLPTMSEKLSYKVLLNPFGRREYSTDLFPAHKEVFLKTPLGQIKLFHFPGGDKHIFLSHGWADSTLRFKYLIQELHKQGYSVWSIDHIGHGKSEGNTSHLFGFIEGIKTSLEYISEQGHDVFAFVTHSMGGVAILNLDKECFKNKKVVLLSLPGNFFENMFEKVKAIGISGLMLLNILEVISKEKNLEWEELSPKKQTYKLDSSFLFIHDTEDKIAKYSEAIFHEKNVKANFFSTTGLGHVKLLKDPSTIKKLINFLDNKEKDFILEDRY